MEWSRCLGVFLLLMVFLLGGLSESEGCWEHEKIALMQLKPFFPYVGWDSEFENCCEWKMVECDSTSGRVIQLFLNQTATITDGDDFIYSNHDYSVEHWSKWYMNASLFLSFEDLKSLYLSGNSIIGCISNHGFERLSSKLDKLEIIDLNCNYFNESILFSLSKLTSLKSLYVGDNQFGESNAVNSGIKQISKLQNLELLDLHSNMFGNNILLHLHGFTSLKILNLQNCELQGTIQMLEFSNMMNLKELYLGYNEIDSLLFNQEKGEVGLLKLEVLGLTENHLDNSILESLGALSSLKRLRIEGNNLKGSINIKVLNAMSYLKELYMSNNEVSAFIPSQDDENELELINLEVLDLSENFFTNSIIPFLSKLSNLNRLSLGGNELTGTIDLRELRDLTNLKELEVTCNSPACSLSLESLDLFLSLKIVSLTGFNFNGTTISQKLHNLEEMRLSSSSLRTNFLQVIGEFTSLKRLTLDNCEVNNRSLSVKELHNFTNLEELWLRDSSFQTNFLQAIGEFTSLKRSTLEDCDVKSGSLIAREGSILNNLEELRLESSSFPSNFIQDVGKMTSFKNLSISQCQFNGSFSLHGQILKSLESLDIETTSLENSILHSIGAMPSLKYISLRECGINGTLHSSGVCELRHLRRFEIHNNNLKGNLPDCLSNLKTLEYLDVSFNQLSGNMSSIKSLPSLEHLDVSYNQLSGNIFSLERLPSLEHLDVSYNQLSGNISSLKSLTSLEHLDLSYNQLSGNISYLQTLTSLRTLTLTNNYFHIPTSLGPFFNHSKLHSFAADNNSIYTETEMSTLAPSFQLQSISLSCCGEGGPFPRFLYYQHDLQYVDLSNINLVGEFPNWLLENNRGLGTLLLTNNSLSSGHFEMPFHPHTVLTELDVAKNSFYGKIPADIGAKLPSLLSLNMSRNSFTGGIPASIGGIEFLDLLDLSNNILTGGIAEPLATGCSILSFLVLSNNNLQGQMCSSNISMLNLIELRLDGNNFSGRIPDCLSQCSHLSTLDVSNNQLVDKIPKWMGDMSNLERIMMPNNHLNGSIPVEFCQLDQLVLLDLSANSISGNLPSCFNPSQIKQVHLSKNRLRGDFPNALRNCSTLMTLDISHNQLSGSIPRWIGGLLKLSYLLLNNNFFEGNIPVGLCNLSHLSLINLSHNNLSGHIPPCLKLTNCASSFPKDESEGCAISLFSLGSSIHKGLTPHTFSVSEPIEFTTKNMSYFYKGRILPYMSGIDLSCNNLIGEIPYEIGNFREILVLNFSHNSLTGPIPPTFSNLTQIESLDLSHNNLSGNIPPQLVGLYYLEYFNVSYNNLSGKIPESTAQFATFDESSYLENYFLCGEPLPKCASNGSSSSMPIENGEDNGVIDMGTFCVTFSVAYVVMLLSIGVVLYINPYWRRVWFYHVETIATSCFYFVLDNILPRKFHCGNI